ncbi:MAG: hypothetical protein ACM3U2_20515, partial [Deltaproteobacteria bacterium]
MQPDARPRSATFIRRQTAAARRIPRLICVALVGLILAAPALAVEPTLSIETPTSPPAWALLERELVRANTAACREFFEKYFDDRGYLLCVERWGGDDGPDDA